MQWPVTPMRAAAIFCGVWSLVAARPVAGQPVLPDARLDIPQVRVPAVAGSGLPAIHAAIDARSVHLRELLRAHRDQLDTDAAGELVVRREILAFAPTASALQAAQAAGFTIRRQRALAGLDATIVVLQVPDGLSTRGALRRLRALDPAGLYDFNHVYLAGGVVSAAAAVPGPAAASSPGRVDGRRVGLIDGGVSASHPALASADLRMHGCQGTQLPTDHGTAVASLMLRAIAVAPTTASRPQVFAADVYCGSPTGGAVDAVAEALAWMLREQVPVVNVSLVGPANGLLARVIALVVAQGQVIVAAVGNDGPAAPPLYPAAYPQVIAVTAVDRHRKVLVEAGRGDFVDFAAPGADLSAAALPDHLAPVRGTSFAAPIVAGLLARATDRPDRAVAASAVQALAAEAQDLGARGTDPVYGHGLVGELPGTP